MDRAFSRHQKQLDNIEADFTPRQWAIMLADEMRRHPSEVEFVRAAAKLKYREMPFKKPYFALAQQVHKAAPKDGQLNAQLRREFHGLHLLINMVNRDVRMKARAAGLQVTGLIDQRSHIIFCDATAGVAHAAATWIRAGDGDDGAAVLNGLRQLKIAAGARRSTFLQARDWADAAAVLLMELYSYESAVTLVQDTYFDRHLILFRDNEGELQSTIEVLLEAITGFNAYVTVKINSYHDSPPGNESEAGWGSLLTNTEEIRQRAREFAHLAVVPNWKHRATEQSILDILHERGQHEGFAERAFRQAYGVKI